MTDSPSDSLSTHFTSPGRSRSPAWSVEMRAIPHLWTNATGRPTREHVCPGHIARVDAWERPRRAL